MIWVIIGIILATGTGFILGTLFGVCIMCCMQINRENDEGIYWHKNYIKERGDSNADQRD